jgi:outer membrane receptor protein involved in Fe transport
MAGLQVKVFGKKAGGVLSVIYNQNNRRLAFDNAIIANAEGDHDLKYENHRYSRDVLAGAMANFAVQLDNNNRISFKNILNVNSSDYVIQRTGKDYILGPGVGDNVRAEELGFRQNTFFNTQLIGEHNLQKLGVRFKWYGGFNILDQYIPDQRRLFYTQMVLILMLLIMHCSVLVLHKRVVVFSIVFLNDYIYNAGTDVSKSFDWLGYKQTLKGGYLFQVKDRLFDSRPFFANTSSNEIKQLSPDKIFAHENFGEGNNQVQFGELTGKPFRYIANTILNAGYVQLDNQFTEKLRMVWGVRIEDYDQVVGSLKQSDERHVHTRVTDFLPGVNLTYKPNNNSNIRLSGSQTVVRPEFRELSPFAFYDFELNAQVVGNNQVRRTKVTNLDLRYEIYPRGGEIITIGAFYKSFNDPLEYYFNRTGPATNTFNVQNSDRATAFGGEFEFRKKLDFFTEALKNFTVTGNVSYIYSRVKDTLLLNRPLQGQSPYLITWDCNMTWSQKDLQLTCYLTR